MRSQWLCWTRVASKNQTFCPTAPKRRHWTSVALRVGDIMRSGSRNPIAHQTMPVRDALLIMGEAKSGSVSVVNKNSKLAGVFTDGDLRRHFGQGRRRICPWPRS